MRALYLLITMAACSAYDEDLGPSPYYCGDEEPRCPSGYTCTDDPSSGTQVCLRSGEDIGNVDCADDSPHEPNNMLSEAKATPVDTMKAFTQENLAICPAGDKDLFSLMVSVANEHVELLVTYNINGAPLRAELLNSGGIPISTATQVEGQPGTVRAFAQNLPGDKYFVRVSSASSTNNYKFTLNVTGP